MAYDSIKNREYVKALRAKTNALKNKPCHDCGIQYPPYMMEFDHVPEKGPKLGNISAFVSEKRIKALEEELKKCEIVCANCHKARTHFRRLYSSVAEMV